ncbi:MAG: DUF4271 domain-containing protein [Tannerellaceae bacterium]|jgi:hypothetical protein|nr:DUF4271 domain-containing protein [Tannerellaceae bacterium]
MNSFDGYVGIRIWDGQLVNDAIFALLLALLIMFAFVYRSNYRLFAKMVRDVFYLKERLSLFETVIGNEFVFRNFMIFQSLFLTALSIFAVGHVYRLFEFPDIRTNLGLISIIFLSVLLYYYFKQFLYGLIGFVFTDPEKYKFWKTNYYAITGFWGVWLYIPVFWLVFIGNYIEIALILFAVWYVLYRFWLIYKSVRIFHIRSMGFIYIFLYLCAQEILPLLFIYECLVYLYNVIEKSAIWH